MTRQWIDLSQEYYEGMPRRVPDRSFHIRTVHKVNEATKRSNVQEFTIYSHQGTHVDSFGHMLEGGETVDKMPPERFTGTGVVLEILKEPLTAITAEDLEKAKPKVESGDIVIIRTGFEDKWYSEEYENCPYLSEDAAKWLVKKQIKMLGMDSLTPDMPFPLRTPAYTHTVHYMLFRNNILIMENLGNLKAVAGKRVTIVAFPLKIRGADGSPTRVMALLE